MTSGSVLVLNRHFQPVNITTVKRAFTLLYMGAAKAVSPDYSTFDFVSWSALSVANRRDVVHTIGRAIRIPRVIILQLYDRLPKVHVRFSRHNIYLRDGDTCQYCAKTLPRNELNLDHVVPRARGGRTTWENVVCCCIPCNLRKGARSPAEIGMRLLRQPVRPTWSPFTRPSHGGRVAHREWIPFLGLVDASYWNAELVDE